MSVSLRTLTHTLGRRETLKYASIAAIGAVIAPLTGCSGSELAFKKFAAGTWTYTDNTDENHPWDVTITVGEDGTWSGKIVGDDYNATGSGVWTLTGTNLTLKEDGDHPAFIRDSDTGTATGVPEEVDQDKLADGSSFTWSYGGGGITVPVTWDEDSQTLTLTGQDATSGGPLVIAVTKQK